MLYKADGNDTREKWPWRIGYPEDGRPEESIREAYHTAALNILEYREQMSRKQKLLLVCALCGVTTEEEEKFLRYFRRPAVASQQ